MHKLRLHVERLRVESFETDAAARGIGTVRGNALIAIDAAGNPQPIDSVDCSANPYTQCQSCYLSCVDTCNQPTCDSCGITRCKSQCG